MTDTEHEFARALREEEQALPGGTLRRLAKARAHALGAARPSRFARLMAPMTGALILASALGVAMLMPSQRDGNFSQSAVPPDNPDLYRDLDFYLWLAESDMGRHG